MSAPSVERLQYGKYTFTVFRAGDRESIRVEREGGLPKDQPTADSAVQALFGALLAERELREKFGEVATAAAPLLRHVEHEGLVVTSLRVPREIFDRFHDALKKCVE